MESNGRQEWEESLGIWMLCFRKQWEATEGFKQIYNDMI